MRKRYSYGKLKVYFGPMFSGKSDVLHRDWDRAVRGGLNVRAFKPAVHTRDGGFSKSRRGGSFPVITVSKSEDIYDLAVVRPKANLVIIDETQMFDDQLPDVIQRLRLVGVSVISAGLALDAFGRQWGPTLMLTAHATCAEKLTAICHVCRYDGAEFTQMLDSHKNPILDLGSGSPLAIESQEIQYQARCGRCIVMPKGDSK